MLSLSHTGDHMPEPPLCVPKSRKPGRSIHQEMQSARMHAHDHHELCALSKCVTQHRDACFRYRLSSCTRHAPHLDLQCFSRQYQLQCFSRLSRHYHLHQSLRRQATAATPGQSIFLHPIRLIKMSHTCCTTPNTTPHTQISTPTSAPHANCASPVRLLSCACPVHARLQLMVQLPGLPDLIIRDSY